MGPSRGSWDPEDIESRRGQAGPLNKRVDIWGGPPKNRPYTAEQQMTHRGPLPRGPIQLRDRLRLHLNAYQAFLRLRLSKAQRNLGETQAKELKRHLHGCKTMNNRVP